MEKKLTPLISAEDVSGLLNDPHVVVIDARGGSDARERYESGHLRGAIFMDLETQLSNRVPDARLGGRHPLPDV
ncbi:MAG TPA: rhodanese-like domain-containing protein, partial [Chryseosolibacter sp.]